MNYVCSKCGKKYDISTLDYRCSCGGLFSLDSTFHISFDIDPGIHSMWRYVKLMPFTFDDQCVRTVSMGEGFTPLIKLNPQIDNLLAKCDYYMPTLSFKDRGAAALIALCSHLGIKSVACDSSGNAGTAISAYCARAGIACDVFVPENTSDKKVAQICAHGAVIHKIPGSREDTAAAATSFVESTGTFYASHIFNPMFYEGTKTYFFELYEQLSKLPDGVIVPVGNGTLLLGAYRAFTQLLQLGLIEKMPKIYAVQAENCAPIKLAFDRGDAQVSPVQNIGTLAEGIAIAAPSRGEDILHAVRSSGGDIISVSEDEISLARSEMSALGVYVEITSAANYAGYKKYCNKYKNFKDKLIVLPLCGGGIKSN